MTTTSTLSRSVPPRRSGQLRHRRLPEALLADALELHGSCHWRTVAERRCIRQPSRHVPPAHDDRRARPHQPAIPDPSPAPRPGADRAGAAARRRRRGGRARAAADRTRVLRSPSAAPDAARRPARPAPALIVDGDGGPVPGLVDRAPGPERRRHAAERAAGRRDRDPRGRGYLSYGSLPWTCTDEYLDADRSACAGRAVLADQPHPVGGGAGRLSRSARTSTRTSRRARGRPRPDDAPGSPRARADPRRRARRVHRSRGRHLRARCPRLRRGVRRSSASSGSRATPWAPTLTVDPAMQVDPNVPEIARSVEAGGGRARPRGAAARDLGRVAGRARRPGRGCRRGAPADPASSDASGRSPTCAGSCSSSTRASRSTAATRRSAGWSSTRSRASCSPVAAPERGQSAANAIRAAGDRQRHRAAQLAPEERRVLALRAQRRLVHGPASPRGRRPRGRPARPRAGRAHPRPDPRSRPGPS